MFQKERRIRCHLVFHIQRHRFLDSEHQTKNREKLSLSCMPQIFYFDVLQKPGKLFPRSEVRHSLALQEWCWVRRAAASFWRLRDQNVLHIWFLDLPEEQSLVQQGSWCHFLSALPDRTAFWYSECARIQSNIKTVSSMDLHLRKRGGMVWIATGRQCFRRRSELPGRRFWSRFLWHSLEW